MTMKETLPQTPFLLKKDRGSLFSTALVEKRSELFIA